MKLFGRLQKIAKSLPQPAALPVSELSFPSGNVNLVIKQGGFLPL